MKEDEERDARGWMMTREQAEILAKQRVETRELIWYEKVRSGRGPTRDMPSRALVWADFLPNVQELEIQKVLDGSCEQEKKEG